ncbi:hypothetical protein KGF54_004276 [Candida jiufengensis]|uniref:uncharacterized protein n=1 Tax=Candida jiufengensis TaxID=497108 RepID=UPI0022252A12|nr:uncharacterized protein KGF54_004276 [Candida jiufengensis]KAI5951202.1 hypothetical protein KGF54_004276 [Candida jiufengensis]
MTINSNHTTEQNIQDYVTAMIHWLSEFPDSPIESDSEFDVFTDPTKLYFLIKCLLSKEGLSYDCIFEQKQVLEKNDDTIVLTRYLDEQIETIDGILSKHFDKFSYLTQLPKVNFHKLIIFDDMYEVFFICQILHVIGTYTSRLASRGQSFVEFLSEEDQYIMKKFNVLSGNDSFRVRDIQNNNVVEAKSSATECSSCDCEMNYNAIKWESNMLQEVIHAIAMEKRTDN